MKVINFIKTDLVTKTVLHAVHQLDGVFEFDKVVVMHNGKVVKEGRPRLLYKQKDSFFQRIYDSEEGVKTREEPSLSIIEVKAA